MVEYLQSKVRVVVEWWKELVMVERQRLRTIGMLDRKFVLSLSMSNKARPIATNPMLKELQVLFNKPCKEILG